MAKPDLRVIDPAARELAARVAREVRARCGPNSTYEERRDMAAAITGEVLAALTSEDADQSRSIRRQPRVGLHAGVLTRAVRVPVVPVVDARLHVRDL